MFLGFTGAENENRLWGTDSFYGYGLFLWLRSLFTVYEVRSLFTVAEVFHNEVSLSPCLFENFHTGDFEIAPSNTPFECILSYHPCVSVLGYQIMFPST